MGDVSDNYQLFKFVNHRFYCSNNRFISISNDISIILYCFSKWIPQIIYASDATI